MPKILMKRNDISGVAPDVSEIELGEITINTYDGKLYTKINNGTEAIIEIGGSGGTPTGLELIDEGRGPGWRLIGRDPDNYGEMARDAVDVSSSYSHSLANGATGQASFAANINTKAMGLGSAAFNNENYAIGDYSFAIGTKTKATGMASFAAGFASEASGYCAISMGYGATASAKASFSCGRNTNAKNENSVAMGSYNLGSSDDTLFEFGIGYFDSSTGAHKKNAFEIYNDGKLTAPELTPDIVDTDLNNLVPVSYLLSPEFGNRLPTIPGDPGTLYKDENGFVKVS